MTQMLGFLPVGMFIGVAWFLRDPITIMSAFILLITISLKFISFRNYSILKNWKVQVIFLLFVVYSASALVNQVNLISAMQGAYQRNNGIIFFFCLFSLLLFATSGDIDESKFIYSLYTVVFFSIIYGLLQIFGADPFNWENPFQAVQLTLGNPNFAGALCGMLLALPNYFGLKAGTKRAITFNTVIFVLILIVGANTDTLQFWLVGSLNLVVFHIVHKFDKVSGIIKHASRPNAKFATIAISLTVILFLSIKYFKKILLFLVSEGNVAQRIDYWKNGIEIFLHHPILGVGPDQFQKYAALYRSRQQVERDGVFNLPDKSHNLVIDHLANGGIFAGLLWILFSMGVLLTLINLLRIRLQESDRLKIALYSAIWISYVMQSLISPDQILLSTIGMISAGLLIRNDTYFKNIPEKITSRLIGSIFLPLTLIFCLTFNYVWVNSMVADFNAKRLLQSRTVSYDQINDTVNAWPMPENIMQIAIEVSKTPQACQILPKIAERLLQIDKENPQAFYAQAFCASSANNFGLGISQIEKALLYDPLNTDYLVARVQLAIAIGDKNLSRRYLLALQSSFPENREISSLTSQVDSLAN